MDLGLVLKDLNQVVDFLLPHLEMANFNNSDFIIDNHWNMLPEKIAEELLQLDGASIAELPSGKVGEHFTSTKVPSCDYNVTLTPLQSFIQNCYLNTLPNLASLSTPDILKHQMDIKFPYLQRPAINSFMSQKKQYEVGLLASLSDEICRVRNINKVVDIGSGLGYLGGYMSLMFGYDVLALDSVKDRTDTAEKRTKLLKKQWISLIQNALSDKNTDGLFSAELGNYKRNFGNSSFTPMCLYITSGAQLDGLCKEHFGAEHPLLFTALHACGDLTPSILKLFIKSSLASAICLVGCCYNLLNEEFLSGDENSGFPMSSHLKEKSFVLGINARSLASQSPDRLSHSKKTPSESLFWRALLQVILVDKFGRPKMKNQWRVGKIASKCNSFHEYVSLSLKKLGLELKITEEETSSYLEKYKDFRRKCLLFHQLRVSLGLCVESLIHLDRLLFLLEQDSVKTAHLVQLFDPVQSPRCYAVIAIKR